MKKLLAILLLAFVSSVTMANQANIFVDAAPNVYGSSDYAPWEAAAFAAAADGSFVNMLNSFDAANIGTTNFEIQDEVVYSFGDLGKRLTWVYYIEDETVDSLTGRIQVKLENTWDGEYLDFYDDYYGTSWLTPTKLYNYGTGVIGIGGMAWWGGYDTNTQAELDSDIADWITVSETWTFSVKLDNEVSSLTSYRDAVAVPAPGALLLAGMGTAAVGRIRRKF